MKINNFILFCKDFYKARGDSDTTWMDMSLAIQADGYPCYTKLSVMQHCIDFLDEYAEESKKNVSFRKVFGEIISNKFFWSLNHDTLLSPWDYIILGIKNTINYTISLSEFTGGVMPNPAVMELNDCVSPLIIERLKMEVKCEEKNYEEDRNFESVEIREARICK